jgi:long-chain acyl-CoA synthetase
MTRITGRVKDLFKTSKGKYVAPAPIEDRLVAHPAVEACCVVGANLGQPLALVMLNAEAMGRAASAPGRAALTASLAATRLAVNATLDSHERLADRKSTRLNSSHRLTSRMPSSA